MLKTLDLGAMQDALASARQAYNNAFSAQLRAAREVDKANAALQRAREARDVAQRALADAHRAIQGA